MKEILTNLFDAKIKTFRLRQLLEIKEKSPEEISEQNMLVEEMDFANEMSRQNEYSEMISEFTSGYSTCEDIDFVIGTIYGMHASIILKKYIDEEKKKKMLKLSAKMWFDMREAMIKQLAKNTRFSTDQPKQVKQ